MTLTDWIGTLGVAMLLFAYFLQLTNKISKDGFTYILLNISGSLVACIASIMLDYIPFIVLELAWALVSIFALLKLVRKT
jgi:hypothetical protein